jgi:hypothetical protein
MGNRAGGSAVLRNDTIERGAVAWMVVVAL